MIAMPAASKADMEAAAVLLGYHPTHLLGFGSMFCDACATNVTTPMGMDECPNALPPVENARNTMRAINVPGAAGRIYHVEERIATRGLEAGQPYLFCPCPAWRFGHQQCKHTEVARRLWAEEK